MKMWYFNCPACGHSQMTVDPGNGIMNAILLVCFFPISLLFYAAAKKGGVVCERCGKRTPHSREHCTQRDV